jgi:5-formyltetrahydrofolate cyclo-ligase
MSSGGNELNAAELSALRGHAKAQIRTQVRAVRRVLPLESCAERSGRACQQLAALPEFATARTLIVYAAMRKELDPSPLVLLARSQGKAIGLPRMEGDVLRLHTYEPHDALEDNGYGVYEPSANAPRIAPERVDFIVVPALALDPRGHRIGYGRGFYDRLLPTLPQAFKVGVAYDFQLIAEAPNDAHDVPMNCVVTDVRVLRPAP